MKKIFLTAVLIGGIAMGFAQCPNLNLSYGNLTNWQCYIGGCSGGNYTRTPSAVIPGRHTVLEITSLIMNNNLYDEKCSVITKVPDGCTYSLKLGNDQIGAETEAVSYRMTVDSSNSLLILSFAYVMGDTSHSPAEQPQFSMTMYDTNWNVLNVPCGNNQFVSNPNLPALACNTGDIVARDWTTIGFNLESLIGQTIIIFFETRDCSQGGHYGYAYLACQCRPMTIDLTYCEGNNAARLRAPNGFTSYLWHRSSQPNWYSTAQQINILNPLYGEEFSCTLVSALGCSPTIKTVITKTSVDANFVYGVKENGGVDIEDPDHCDQYGVFQNYYDTCTRTATFVEMSNVVNNVKNNVEWSAVCRTKVNGIFDTTWSLLNLASTDSLFTFTFPDPGEEGNDPIDYLIRLLVIAENGCGKESDSTAQHWIRIYPSPKVEIIGDDYMCEGDTAILTANQLKSYFVQYHWIYKRDSNNRATTFEDYGEILTIHGPGLYILEGKDSVGCYAYDTLEVINCTDLGLAEQEGNVVFLGQNIPNPVNAQTVVNYQVPTEGTVVFTLTTVTGQVIYTTTQEVAAGRNSVEFNTENLAAGIYFYTMDFNGQRLTKKMIVKK